jgi:hypothetical protein
MCRRGGHMRIRLSSMMFTRTGRVRPKRGVPGTRGARPVLLWARQRISCRISNPGCDQNHGFGCWRMRPGDVPKTRLNARLNAGSD